MGTTSNTTNRKFIVRNPLRRDGTSQRQRFPAALDPSYVKIDERGLEDFLVFANQYASLINYYDQGNQLNGDWLSFFDKDISVNIALMAKSDVKALKNTYDTAVGAFKASPSATTWEVLFKQILGVGLFIEGWNNKMIPENGFKAEIQNTIESDLVGALKKLIEYDHAGTDSGVPFSPPLVTDAEYMGLGPDWYRNGDVASSIGLDISIYEGATPAEKFLNAFKYVNPIFEAFYNAAFYLVDRAPSYLEESLTNYQYHEPHMALYLTFIQLFRHAQDHINTLTLRHLDFYYKEVLRFLEKEEVPDQAHILFEPGKNVTQHRVDAGTLLDAGRDALGNKLTFETDRELIISNALVDELKTIFVDRSTSRTTSFYAASDADSQDGEGAPLLGDEKKWPTLGEGQVAYQDEDRTMPDGSLGFAVASPVLLLKEGKRQAYIGMVFEKGNTLIGNLSRGGSAGLEVELRNNLKVQLTGEEGWIEKAPSRVLIVNDQKPIHALSTEMNVGVNELNALRTNSQALLVIGVELDAEDPAVLPYDEAIHADGIATSHPMAKVTFGNEGYAFENALVGQPNLFDYDFYLSSNSYQAGFVVAHEGRIYEAIQNITANDSITNTNLWREIDTVKDLVIERVFSNNFITSYLEGQQYTTEGPSVFLNNQVYRLMKNPTSPPPFNGSEYWEEVVSDSNDTFPEYATDATYQADNRVMYFGKVYSAKKDSVPGVPSPTSEEWCLDLDYTKVNPYQYMEDLVLDRIHIKVRAEGVADLVLQNDFGKLDPAKSFQPWSSRPVVGGNFYIGSPEVFNKRLSSVDLQLDWEGLPAESFAEHYFEYRGKNYLPSNFAFGHQQYNKLFTSTTLNLANPTLATAKINGKDIKLYKNLPNSAFQARVSFLDGNGWVPSTVDRQQPFVLFGSNTNGSPAVSRSLSVRTNLPQARDPQNTSFKAYKADATRGFMRLELLRTQSYSPATFLSDFDTVVAVDAVPDDVFVSFKPGVGDLLSAKQSKMLGSPVDTGAAKKAKLGVKSSPITGKVQLVSYVPSDRDLELPNEPYTPMISGISLDYESSEIVDLKTDGRSAYDNRVEQFFHLHPFGYEEVHPFLLEGDEVASAVPQYPNEGYLFIGLDNLNVPQTLPLFFQMADGSGDPELNQPSVSWSALVRNRWKEIDNNQILFDSTNGLLTSGIIEFSLSQFATDENTLMPSGKHWLRATVAQDTAALSKSIEIKANAVSATYVNSGNDPERLREPLEEESIKKMVVKDASVKAVTQPYTSFGGRVRESGNDFYTRVSERLRHKQRSITIFDYERMVLEEFPEIYKVKCLNHTSQTGDVDTYCELSPGHVMVVTIPDLRNKNAVNPFEPRTSLNVLSQIDRYLSQYITPFIDLKVKNPFYEKIRVSFDIGFHEEYDAGFYSKELNDGINKFLSPWAFDEGQDIIFGGKVHWSVILNFIEEQPYVDFVNNFKMDHIANGVIYEDVEEAVATTSRSILVAAENHYINVLEPGTYECKGDKVFSGVDFWIVEGDFIVQ